MAEYPKDTPARIDPDGQSTRPANWPGIPPPDEEHLGTLATHGETEEEPARVTRAQRELEQEEAGDRLEWEDPEETKQTEGLEKEKDDETPRLA
jgi:hypothetical protein